MARTRIVYGTKRRYFLDDREVTAEEFHAEVPTRIDDLLREGLAPGGHLPSCWPMKSMALGVHPKQVQEANERNKRNGVDVTYDRNGRAVIPDRNERKKLLRLEGFRDNNGGYGD